MPRRVLVPKSDRNAVTGFKGRILDLHRTSGTKVRLGIWAESFAARTSTTTGTAADFGRTTSTKMTTTRSKKFNQRSFFELYLLVRVAVRTRTQLFRLSRTEQKKRPAWSGRAEVAFALFPPPSPVVFRSAVRLETRRVISACSTARVAGAACRCSACLQIPLRFGFFYFVARQLASPLVCCSFSRFRFVLINLFVFPDTGPPSRAKGDDVRQARCKLIGRAPARRPKRRCVPTSIYPTDRPSVCVSVRPSRRPSVYSSVQSPAKTGFRSDDWVFLKISLGRTVCGLVNSSRPIGSLSSHQAPFEDDRPNERMTAAASATTAQAVRPLRRWVSQLM